MHPPYLPGMIRGVPLKQNKKEKRRQNGGRGRGEGGGEREKGKGQNGEKNGRKKKIHRISIFGCDTAQRIQRAVHPTAVHVSPSLKRGEHRETVASGCKTIKKKKKKKKRRRQRRSSRT